MSGPRNINGNGGRRSGETLPLALEPMARDRVPAEGDVIIVGGGVVGLTFALLLASESAWASGRTAPRTITVLDREPPAAAPTDLGLRVFAVSPASRAILAAAGAWAGLPASRVHAYQSMRVWEAGGSLDGPGSIHFDAALLGRPELGFIVEHDSLRWQLWEAARRHPRIALVTDWAPTALAIDQRAATLTDASGISRAARLVVGADGTNSWVRRQLSLPVAERSYGQRAIVAHLAGERPHHDTAFQVFLPTGPVALLPLADGRSSLVWSCREPLADELLAANPDEFAARLSAAIGAARGALQLTTGRAAFPLAASHAHRYTGARFALIGDAAHQVHPLAGQGINLGLLDAAALAETLGAHCAETELADCGDARVLGRYQRWRKGDNLLTLGALDGLHRLFTSTVPGVVRLGAAGMGAVDSWSGLKRWLAERAMGQGADLPRVARS